MLKYIVMQNISTGSLKDNIVVLRKLSARYTAIKLDKSVVLIKLHSVC